MPNSTYNLILGILHWKQQEQEWWYTRKQAPIAHFKMVQDIICPCHIISKNMGSGMSRSNFIPLLFPPRTLYPITVKAPFGILTNKLLLSYI